MGGRRGQGVAPARRPDPALLDVRRTRPSCSTEPAPPRHRLRFGTGAESAGNSRPSRFAAGERRDTRTGKQLGLMILSGKINRATGWGIRPAANADLAAAPFVNGSLTNCA